MGRPRQTLSSSASFRVPRSRLDGHFGIRNSMSFHPGVVHSALVYRAPAWARHELGAGQMVEQGLCLWGAGSTEPFTVTVIVATESSKEKWALWCPRLRGQDMWGRDTEVVISSLERREEKEERGEGMARRRGWALGEHCRSEPVFLSEHQNPADFFLCSCSQEHEAMGAWLLLPHSPSLGFPSVHWKAWT